MFRITRDPSTGSFIQCLAKITLITLVGKPEGKRPLGRPVLKWKYIINPLNTELNPICHLLALLEAHHILQFSRIRVKMDLQKNRMGYLYG
jgi:hypothetical protein